MMDIFISDFHTIFEIPEIQNLAFHSPNARILCTHQCGNQRHDVFQCREFLQYVLCPCDYSYQVVASFPQKIESKYYGGNEFVSIEGIALYYFNSLQ